ncbi:tetratricopeptide repeat protein [soil metagenome]
MNIMLRLTSRTLPLLVIVPLLALTACQSNKTAFEDSDSLTTGSTEETGSLKETAKAGQLWEKDRGNIKLGMAYAAQLHSLDQKGQELDVLKTLVENNPNDQKLLVYFGKQLIEGGQSEQASIIFGKAIAAGNTDWKVYSAMGSSLDQQGKYAAAREYYDRALKARPNEISVLNNLGMSFALEGNLAKAEETLRQASSLPEAKSQPRLRQNLALVVGLQGRFDEARKIASTDLPPDQVDANMAYLQTMLAQPNTWQKLQTGAAAG